MREKRGMDPILKVVGSWVETPINTNQRELEEKKY
jgi:hypothetical protein